MPKIVTLRLTDQLYRFFRICADADNRPLSNFIETAAKRYVDEHDFVDAYEMTEIRANDALNQSIQKGHKDAKNKKGRFVG